RLTRSLQCEDRFGRLVAGMVLFRLGWKQESLPILLRLLEERPHWYWQLADTLAEAGPAARPALILVSRALTHPDRLMYLAARRIARKVDPEAVQRVWSVKRLAARSRGPFRLSRDQMKACWTAL